MIIEWNESKNQSNIQRHGLDFRDVEIFFSGSIIQKEDVRKHYGETRWVAYGFLKEIFAVVVYTLRNDNPRIISMRYANKRERGKYEQQIRTKTHPLTKIGGGSI